MGGNTRWNVRGGALAGAATGFGATTRGLDIAVLFAGAKNLSSGPVSFAGVLDTFCTGRAGGRIRPAGLSVCGSEYGTSVTGFGGVSIITMPSNSTSSSYAIGRFRWMGADAGAGVGRDGADGVELC